MKLCKAIKKIEKKFGLVQGFGIKNEFEKNSKDNKENTEKKDKQFKL